MSTETRYSKPKKETNNKKYNTKKLTHNPKKVIIKVETNKL